LSLYKGFGTDQDIPGKEIWINLYLFLSQYFSIAIEEQF